MNWVRPFRLSVTRNKIGSKWYFKNARKGIWFGFIDFMKEFCYSVLVSENRIFRRNMSWLYLHKSLGRFREVFKVVEIYDMDVRLHNPKAKGETYGFGQFQRDDPMG
jgi:hypothetical protein